MFCRLHPIEQSEYLKKEEGLNLNFPPQLHGKIELVVLLEGSMSVHIDGRELALRCAWF